MKFLAAPDTNILIMNNELTKKKIKIIVVINLKWHNLDYPCYPAGRPKRNFSCDHQTQYSLNGDGASDCENWPVILATFSKTSWQHWSIQLALWLRYATLPTV
jgi:hypothetical protein